MAFLFRGRASNMAKTDCHPGQARSVQIRDRRLNSALPAVPDLRFACPG